MVNAEDDEREVRRGEPVDLHERAQADEREERDRHRAAQPQQARAVVESAGEPAAAVAPECRDDDHEHIGR